MPVFHLRSRGYSLMLNGEIKRFGDKRVVELEEGVLAEALRLNKAEVEELAFLPDETLHYYVSQSNSDADYPLPVVSGKPAVIVGRGLSSRDYRSRYNDGYVTCGVNPASIPMSRGEVRKDPTDGVHAGDYSFDCVVSLDQYYYSQAYLDAYKGPVLGPEAHRTQYRGCGTYHSISHILPCDASLSFGLALLAMTALGASDIILCGCDFAGDYAGLRASAQATIERVKQDTRVWVDKENIWKPVGVEVWSDA